MPSAQPIELREIEENVYLDLPTVIEGALLIKRGTNLKGGRRVVPATAKGWLMN